MRPANAATTSRRGRVTRNPALRIRATASAALSSVFAPASTAERVGGSGNEDWSTWWDAVSAEPALAGAVAERERRGARGGSTQLSARRHERLLRTAGFSEVGTVWQTGDDMVLVAVR